MWKSAYPGEGERELNALKKANFESFVDAMDIPAVYFQKPYHVAPGPCGKKPFALLRDVLSRTGKAGIARVVISSKQHLAAVMPTECGLVLNLLRWADEVREPPASVLEADTAEPSERELMIRASAPVRPARGK